MYSGVDKGRMEAVSRMIAGGLALALIAGPLAPSQALELPRRFAAAELALEVQFAERSAPGARPDRGQALGEPGAPRTDADQRCAAKSRLESPRPTGRRPLTREQESP